MGPRNTKLDFAPYIPDLKDQVFRCITDKDEWYFSILDIICILANTSNPRRYWPELKKQLSDTEGFIQLLGRVEQLKLEDSMLYSVLLQLF